MTLKVQCLFFVGTHHLCFHFLFSAYFSAFCFQHISFDCDSNKSVQWLRLGVNFEGKFLLQFIIGTLFFRNFSLLCFLVVKTQFKWLEFKVETAFDWNGFRLFEVLSFLVYKVHKIQDINCFWKTWWGIGINIVQYHFIRSNASRNKNTIQLNSVVKFLIVKFLCLPVSLSYI